MAILKMQFLLQSNHFYGWLIEKKLHDKILCFLGVYGLNRAPPISDECCYNREKDRRSMIYQNSEYQLMPGGVTLGWRK